MRESTGYKQKCNKCLSVWDWVDDYCPECGSDDIYEFHPAECECKDCKNLLHIVKLKEE